jgi:uncharacterized protein YifE (UPF0438 family)
MSASREKKFRKENRDAGPSISGKKMQARQDARRRVFKTTFITVVAAVLFALIITGSGILQANMTALTIGEVKIKGAEFDFHYFTAVNQGMEFFGQFGVDFNRSLRRQDSLFGEGTMADYFEEEATDSLKSIVAQSEAARRAGITLTAEDIEEIDAIVSQAEEFAAMEGINVNRLLRQHFGRGINLASYRGIIERMTLSDRYRTETLDSFDRSETALQAFYEENRDGYDFADYRVFSIPAYPSGFGEQESYTDEEADLIDEFKAGRKALAEEMLSRVTTEEEFFALALEFGEQLAEPEDHDGHYHDDHEHDHDYDDRDDHYDYDDYDHDNGDEADGGEEPADEPAPVDEPMEEEEPAVEIDNTLVAGVRLSSLQGELAEWMLDADRAAGDRTMIEGEEDFAVVLFVRRYRDEGISSDVRHLLIQVDEDDEDFDTPEKARARAEELLQIWKDGAADEDFFAELATEFTTDTGSAATGGLYAGITPESGFMEPFRDWATDPAREEGDTGIVEVDDWYHGFHIMFFVGRGDAAWQTEVKRDMDNEEYGAHLDALVEAIEARRNWLGMLFAGNKA